MLFSSINLPIKKESKNTPITIKEKRFKRYLKRKRYNYGPDLNIRSIQKMIESCDQKRKIDYLDDLNYMIHVFNNCPVKHRNTKVLEFVEVPKDREIILDTKNILLKAKLGKDYTHLKHIKKMKNHSIIGPQSVDKALYNINFLS